MNIAAMLQSLDTFNHKYNKPIGLQVFLMDKEKGLDKKLLDNCNLFIYQNISRESGYGENLSTDYVKTLLPANCKFISIPVCYFKGYLSSKCRNPFVL